MRISIGGNAKQIFSGRNAGKASFAEISSNTPNRLDKQFQQNLQRAADSIIIQHEGKEYALVADYNFIFNDAHWGNSDLYGKQIGGKICVIEDPFEKKGKPKFLGATTPIVGGAIDHLSLSPDGNKLLADVWVDEPTAGGSHAYRALFVWDAHALITAALEADARGQKLSTPIDRVAGKKGQIAAATPVRYNGAEKDTYFGWIYDIGTFKENITVAQQGNYGDVIGVDLAELVAMKTLGLTPNGT